MEEPTIDNPAPLTRPGSVCRADHPFSFFTPFLRRFAMRQIHTKTLMTALAATAGVGFANAGTIDSSSFNVDPASTSINTAGALDWGYFLPNAGFLAGDQPDNTDFDSLKADPDGEGGFNIDPATNSKASPSIGTVTISERGDGGYTNGSTSVWDFTVTDGINPVSGTQTPLGAVNGIAPGEDIFNITFNDIGAGTTTFNLYMAYSSSRTFDATVDLTAADGNVSNPTLTSDSTGDTAGVSFTYTAEVTTTDPLADLSISIDSGGGGFGQFAFAGYTVVPEPGSLALLGLGGLLIARRRRS